MLAWCYERDVPIVPRGGGTGAAAGAVPDGGVVLALDRLDRVRSFEPELWRIHVEAGVPTGRLKQLVRESGLMFAPDPGRARAVADRRQHRHQRRRAARVQVRRRRRLGDGARGGDPAGGARLRRRRDPQGRRRLRPQAPARRLGGDARDRHRRVAEAPARARGRAPGRDLPPRDRGGLRGARCAWSAAGSSRPRSTFSTPRRSTAAAPRFPAACRTAPGSSLLAEADGSRDEAERIRAELVEAAGRGRARRLRAPRPATGVDAFWRWRSGLAFAVLARRGGKVAEDIVVPLDRVEEAMDETLEIGRRHDLVGALVRPRGRRQPPLDVPRLSRRPGRAARGRRSRSRSCSSWRSGSAARSPASTASACSSAASSRASGRPRALDLHAEIKRALRPEEPAQPGQEARRGRCPATRTSRSARGAERECELKNRLLAR